MSTSSGRTHRSMSPPPRSAGSSPTVAAKATPFTIRCSMPASCNSSDTAEVSCHGSQAGLEHAALGAGDLLRDRFWRAESNEMGCEQSMHSMEEHCLGDGRPLGLGWGRRRRCTLSVFGVQHLDHGGGGPSRPGVLHRRSLPGRPCSRAAWTPKMSSTSLWCRVGSCTHGL